MVDGCNEMAADRGFERWRRSATAGLVAILKALRAARGDP